jgi:hypothetical protein
VVRALILLLVLCCACQRREPAREERALAVQLSGCAALLRGPVCELASDRRLRAVVPMVGHERVLFTSDHGPVRVLERSEVTGGKRFRLELPGGARGLSVELEASTYRARFRHALAAQALPAWFRASEDARKAGRSDEAEALARAHIGDARERAFALDVLARIALRRGELAQGGKDLREAAALHARAGRISDAQHDLLALAFFLTEELDTRQADALLDEAQELGQPSPDESLVLTFFRGQSARAAGDFERALALMASCEREARRLGDTLYTSHALWQRMNILLLLGNTREVFELYHALAREPGLVGSACDEQNLLLSLANARNALFSEALAPEARQAYQAQTLALLHEAQRIGDTGCHDSRVMANTLLELARTHLLDGERAQAEQALAQSQAALAGHAFRELSLEAHYLRGRMALERDDHAGARAEFERMEEATQGARWLEPHARALAYQARAEQGVSAARALASYARMEDALDRLVDQAPLGAVRAGLSAALDRYSTAHALLLVDEQRPGEAFEVVLHGRARRTRLLLARARVAALPVAQRAAWHGALAGVQRARRASEALDEHAWELDASQRRALDEKREQLERTLLRAIDRALQSLPVPHAPASAAPAGGFADDELVLTFVVGPQRALAITRRGAHYEARALARPDADAAAWLAELAPALEGVKRLYLLPLERDEELDFHALSVGEGPLGERLEVLYSLGQPRPLRARLPEHARMLVVADPSGNLAAARSEAAWLERELGPLLQATPSVLAEPTTASLREALLRSDAFHFAGHTSFDPEQPWRLALVLAHDSRFGLADVLALPAAPPLVVLSACEGARGSARSALGTAFVSAGSQVVVAATRVVADALSLRFSQAFYRALSERREPAWASQRASAELRAAGEREWAAFRVLVP